VNQPLVTFALLSYNQERFIRDGIKGALTQTYSPLEIIISDDCSQDRSFEIIQDEVANYKGPHQILLNRNGQNLGVGGHINRVMELAKGELIVVAAGDDVSLPSRSEELVRVWSKGGIFSIWSNAITVDEHGVEQGPFAQGASVPVKSWQEMAQIGGTGVLGATHAWDRTVFDKFGPLPEGTIQEDVVIPFRSALLGKISYVDKCLVKYRLHSAAASYVMVDRVDLWQLIKHHTAWAQGGAVAYEGWLRDIWLCLSADPEIEANLYRAVEMVRVHAEFYKFKGTVAESHSRIHRLRSFWRTARDVRKLGIKPTVKMFLLSWSPITYYRTQLWFNRLASRYSFYNIHSTLK
jgi:glycosyltransferase involved in cell wall biosynthesis